MCKATQDDCYGIERGGGDHLQISSPGENSVENPRGRLNVSGHTSANDSLTRQEG